MSASVSAKVFRTDPKEKTMILTHLPFETTKKIKKLLTNPKFFGIINNVIKRNNLLKIKKAKSLKEKKL